MGARIGRGVEPRTFDGRVYRSEYTWQVEEGPTYRRASRRVGHGKVIRELPALRLVRPILPGIRTREQLFLATAWEACKIVLGAGQVRYLDVPLRRWARGREAA